MMKKSNSSLRCVASEKMEKMMKNNNVVTGTRVRTKNFPLHKKEKTHVVEIKLVIGVYNHLLIALFWFGNDLTMQR